MGQRWRVGKYITGLLITLLVLTVSPVLVLAAQQAVVKGSSVNIRSGPGTNHKITGSALRGDMFVVTGKSGDWYQVKLPGGSAGWIAAFLVNVSGSTAGQAKATSPVVPAVTGQAVVKGSILNMRSGPGTGYQVAGQLKQGAVLQILGKPGDWLKIKTSAGSTGWVASWLVTVNKPAVQTNTTPSPAPAPAAATEGWKAVVSGSVVNVRSGPGTNNKITGKFNRGTSLQVLEKSGDWYKVQTPSGAGWMFGSLLKVTGAPATPSPSPVVPASKTSTVASGGQAVINGTNVNIRSGPGTEYDVVSRASMGDRLPLVDQSSYWYKVKLPGGYYGWVVSWLTEVDDPQQPTPEGDNKSPANVPGYKLVGGVIPPASNDNTVQHAEQSKDSGSVQSSEQSKDQDSMSTQPPEQSKDQASGSIQPPEQGDTTKPEEQNDTDNQANTDLALKSILIKEDGRKTGVTVESMAPISNVSVFRLSGPDRLVVDLEGVQPGTLSENVEAGTELVSDARLGWYSHSPDTVRLVLELNGPCYNSTKLSDDKKTLLLELSPPGPGQTLAGSTIVLDPGHGGKDPGAIGSTGLQEKTVALDIALKAAEYLRQKGANVVLTREDDTFVDLYPRPAMATSSGAAAFVSIHMNASPNRSVDGTTTYYVRTPTTGGDQLKAEGSNLAKKLQSRVQGALGTRNIGVLEADFVVLKASDVPAALVEVAFISNSNEEKMMKTEEFKDKAAKSIAEGIADYFGK